jgi:EmrB/QacA subfamily drug resistance transporter
LTEYKWIVFSNTTIASLMSSIDSSIVLIALPTILKQLPGTGANEALWIVMSYMLVTSVFLLNFGRIGDMFGRVKTYNLGFAVFTGGSFLCSLSQTGDELVVFRILQALGSALLYANAGALLTDAFPLNQRGKALGINQAVLVSGSIIGLVLGGILTSEFGWRSIFWVNVPIGVFATLWAHYKLRELATIKRHQKLDIWGNLTFAGGLSIILMGVTLGALESWGYVYYGMIALGAALLVSFTIVETKVAEPMFDLSLFRIKIFSGGTFSGLVSGVARGGFIFMMSFYLQGVLGDSALTAAILLIPISVAVALVGPLSGVFSDRYGSFYFASVGLGVTGIAFVIMSQIPADIRYALLVIPLIVMGTGWGLFGSPIRSETLSSVPAARRGVGNAMTVNLINIGMLVSLAMSIVIISSSVPHSVVVSVFGGGGLAGGPGGPSIRDVSDFMNGLHNVYALSAGLCFLSILPLLSGFRKIGSREKRAHEEEILSEGAGVEQEEGTSGAE